MFEQYHEQVSIIRYHYGGGDPFYDFNPTECFERVYYYPPENGAYFPHGFIDGIVDGEWLYETWGDLVEQRLQIVSPLEIEVGANWNYRLSTLLIAIQVTAVDSINYGDLRLHCVLVESELVHGDETFHQVMRDMIPDAQGEHFNISYGQILEFSRAYEFDPRIERANSDLVVFVQEYSNYDILQTCRLQINQIPVGIEDDDHRVIPSEVSLKIHPNPFNSSANIEFELDEESEVRLSVFNVAGQKVADILHGIYQSGKYHVKWDADKHPSGVYFYKLEANSLILSRKAILLK